MSFYNTPQRAEKLQLLWTDIWLWGPEPSSPTAFPRTACTEKKLGAYFCGHSRVGMCQVLKYSSAHVSAGYHWKQFWGLLTPFWVKELYYQRIWQIVQTHEQDLDNVRVAIAQELIVIAYVFIKSGIQTIFSDEELLHQVWKTINEKLVKN